MTDYSSPDELLAVVNDRDEEIGAETRAKIHEHNLLHRAVHVLVFDAATGDMYLQQRSASKDTFPLHWECVGGHIGPGETYEAAARREVEEELGVRAAALEFLGKVSASEVTGYEFIEVYRATIAEAPVPNAEEIIAVDRFPAAELTSRLGDGRKVSPVLLHTLRELHFR